MKINNKYPSILIVLILSACGGGGGGVSTPVAVTPPVTCIAPQVLTNGACVTPAPTVTPADLQVSVPTPPFVSGSEDLKAFDFFNDFRSSLGLGKLAYSAELTKSASNHQAYIYLNYKEPNFSFHIEDPTKLGFTGLGPFDRAHFAGYATNGRVSEDAAFHNTKSSAFQRLIDTVYHRNDLMKQSYRDIGSNWSESPDGGGSLIVNIGYKTAQRNASDFVMVYPRDGQTNISKSMCGESPWPFPEIKVEQGCTLVGYPISFIAEASQDLLVTSFTVVEGTQTTPMSAWLLTKSNDPNLYLQKNEAYLTAKGALKPNTQYSVSFSGSINGKPVEKKWSFTTGS